MTTKVKGRGPIVMEELYALFDEYRCRPAKIAHQFNGTTGFVWFVDNNDDRFVEARDSVRGTDFLVVWRDGKEAAAIVVDKPKDVVEMVVAKLRALAAGCR